MAEPDKASPGKMRTKKLQVLQAMDTEPLSGPLFELKWSEIWLGPETGQGQRGDVLREPGGGLDKDKEGKCSESQREAWQLRILPSAHSRASYPEVSQIACLPFSRTCGLLNAETQECPAGVSRNAKAGVWGSHTPQFSKDPLLLNALFWNLQAKEKASNYLVRKYIL